jgi:NDP-sugar pyrophosphorylase family protein
MAKKRISLTLAEELVEQVDAEAGSQNANRSQLVEEIVREHFDSKGLDTAVILCGDSDVSGLEEHRGSPVLNHILEHLEDEGFRRVIMLVGRNARIKERFGPQHGALNLEYVEEEKPRGTAAALTNLEDRIERGFAVLNGHVITDVDFREMVELHRDEETVATMALTTVEDPSEYGVARLKGSKILGFVEKPDEGEEPSRLINAGAYILEPEIFDELEEDSLEEVFERLASHSRLAGYIYGGKWRKDF